MREDFLGETVITELFATLALNPQGPICFMSVVQFSSYKVNAKVLDLT